MTSSNIFVHTPFWTWNPILDISGTGSCLVTKIPRLDSQYNFASGNDVIKNWGLRPYWAGSLSQEQEVAW
jgi:hypothetical protein